VLFVAISLIFIVYAWRKNENIEAAKTSHGFMEKMSITIELKLEKIFSNLGVFCASNPLKVLFIGKL
jgi:hypothetical protein